MSSLLAGDRRLHGAAQIIACGLPKDFTLRTARFSGDRIVGRLLLASGIVRAKLHYTDTGYGHHQRTSSQQFYNKFATSQCQSPTSRRVKMLGCGKFLSVGGVRWWCSYMVFVAGVRVVEFGS